MQEAHLMRFMLDGMIIISVINVALCVLIMLFGFKEPEKDPEYKPLEFDWRKEGF